MSIKYLKNALAVGSAKEAALYFDVVVPLDRIAGMTDRESTHAIGMQRKPERILKSLLPDVYDPASFYRGHEGISSAFWGLVALEKTQQERGAAQAFFDLDPDYVKEIVRCVRFTFDEDLEAIAEAIDQNAYDFESYRSRVQDMVYAGLEKIGFNTYSTWHDPFYSDSCADPGEGQALGPDTVSVVLRDLELVDADKISWRKILQIRKDERAHAELRDLRLFLHESVSGLEREAAIDKINSYIDRYQAQIRAWNLDTIKKSLSMVVSKEGVGLTAIGTLASLALTGVPVDPTLAFSTLLGAVKGGAALNLGGNAVLQFAEARIEKRKLVASPDSAVRYFQRIRNV